MSCFEKQCTMRLGLYSGQRPAALTAQGVWEGSSRSLTALPPSTQKRSWRLRSPSALHCMQGAGSGCDPGLVPALLVSTLAFPNEPPFSQFVPILLPFSGEGHGSSNVTLRELEDQVWPRSWPSSYVHRGWSSSRAGDPGKTVVLQNLIVALGKGASFSFLDHDLRGVCSWLAPASSPFVCSPVWQ